MRLIDADDFGNRMYHEAFEKDSDLQKWDSGCWIRYKLFENVLREQPTVQPERKRGHWRQVDPITEAMSPRGWMPWYCSECGVGVGKHQTTFCPNCGADMRGKQDETD